MYIDHIKSKESFLLSLGFEKPIPCTIEEIEEIETWLHHRLPGAYREFLLWMGHSGGGILRGSDCFYEHLKDIQVWAQELLEENDFPGTVPPDSFVFFMHQGYQFNFFLLNNDDDPPVYFYIEEDPPRSSFTEIYRTFSEFLLTEIEGHIKLQKEMNKN